MKCLNRCSGVVRNASSGRAQLECPSCGATYNRCGRVGCDGLLRAHRLTGGTTGSCSDQYCGTTGRAAATSEG